MGNSRGELNLGQLCHERFASEDPNRVCSIGFSTHTGQHCLQCLSLLWFAHIAEEISSCPFSLDNWSGHAVQTISSINTSADA